MPSVKTTAWDRAWNTVNEKWHVFLAGVAYKEDADRKLSYFTRQQVVFHDWRLGVVFWSIQVSMAILVFGYALLYKEGYLDTEGAKGAVVTHVTGDALSVSTGKPGTRYFSTEELTYPGLENGNVFIATRQTVHKQRRQLCEDPDMPCKTDADCVTSHGNGTCTTLKGLCRVHSWCNVEEQPERYAMAVDTVQIWVRSFIQFLRLDPERLFTTDGNTSQPNTGNTFSVRHLLSMVEPQPVHYEEVAELGGIFEVGIRWQCSMHQKAPCKPDASIRRLDDILDPDDIGCRFSYAEHIGVDQRLKYDVSGLRFFFRATGIGKKLSLSTAITTVSTSGSLASLAVIIVDLLLVKLFRDRGKFISRKFEQSPDFEPLMQRKEEEKAVSMRLTDVEKGEEEVVRREREWMIKFHEDA